MAFKDKKYILALQVLTSIKTWQNMKHNQETCLQYTLITYFHNVFINSQKSSWHKNYNRFRFY